MKQENNLQKYIGIFSGIIVLLGVLYVTIFWGKQSPFAQVATPVTDQNTVSTTNPLQNPKPPTTPITPKKAPSRNITTGESDDNEGSPVSQNIPVPVPAPAPKPTPKPVTTPPPVIVPKKTVYLYRDGVYSATGSYFSPGGYDQLGVSLTLKNDIIVAASVTNMAGDGTSSRYQDRFIASYQPYVIGKNISGLSLNVISGASLTTQGFNDALSQIKSQAAV
jgi:hypothetical protein